MEMVIVLAIMAILISLSMVATKAIRETNRDSKRVTDVIAIRGALSDYYTAHKTYPETIATGDPIASTSPFVGAVTYLDKVPANPTPIDGNCENTTDYQYTKTADGDYTVKFCLGNRVGDWGPGTNYISAEDDTSCIPDCVLSCPPYYNGCDATLCAATTQPTGYTCVNSHWIKD